MKNPETIIRGIMHESVMSAVKKHVGTTNPNKVERHFKHDEKAAEKIAELAKSMEEALDINALRDATAHIKFPPQAKPVEGTPPRRKLDLNRLARQLGGNKSERDLNALRDEQNEIKEEQLHEKSAAWQRKEGKDPEGGLNKKGVESYRRENPGSNLQTAVTTDPKKLKKGSKKAKRRLSFCRRMKGMKRKLTSAKTARDPNSRINKSLRKWNCE